MARCSGIKRDGGRCRGQATVGSDYCFTHDPARAKERQERNAKGGRIRSRVAEKTGPLWSQIEEVIADVKAGRLSPAQANSMIRGFNSLVDLARFALEAEELGLKRRELALDIEERTELKRRIEALEAAEENPIGWRRG